MRFGLVGTGHWARVAHAPGIVAADGADLVAVWGRRPEAAQVIADQHHARAYDDFDALLDDVDAVAFSVPPDVQAPMATHAARAGKHLMLDKPIALDVSEADALVAAVTEAGVASSVFFTSQFQPEVRAWLANVNSTADWEGGTAHWLGSAFEKDGPYANSPWRHEKGGLWDVGPHILAMLTTILGPVDRVSAERGPRDVTSLVLHHTSGTASTATLSINSPAAAAVTDLVVWGPRGRSWMPDWHLEPAEGLRIAVQELMGAAASGQLEHGCDVRHGRDIVAVIADAAEQLEQRAG